MIDTPEFQRWFGGSQVVDGTGRPLVVYHGTDQDFHTFRANSRGVHFVSLSPEWVAKLRKSPDGTFPPGENVMPVYVVASNPFDFENNAHVKALAAAASLGALAISEIKKGSWSRIEDRTTLQAIKSLGFDGFYVREDGVKNLAVFEPEQIKSAIGNSGRFDPMDPDITDGAARLEAKPAVRGFKP